MLGGFKTVHEGQEQHDESQSAYLLDKKANTLSMSDAHMHHGVLDGAEMGKAGRESSGTVLARQTGRERKIPPYIMLPDGQARNVWLQLQLAVAMYIIWVTPIRVGFNLPAEGSWFWVEGIIDAFFYFDLALNFFIAYEDPVTGDIIADQKKIATRYLKGWFAVDLLATFPVDYIVRAVQGTWVCSLRGNCSWAVDASVGGVSTISLLRIVRIFRIIWILKHFKFMRFSTILGSLADDLYAIMPLISILELLVVLLYLGHFSGCFFYLMSTHPYQTAVEKRLIAEGELTTWITHAFGGDRMIMVPTLYHGNATQGIPSIGQDPAGKSWYQCPDFGYDFKLCPGCDGPKARCVSHYSLAFRYVTSMYWAYTTMTTVGYGDISSVTVAEKVWAIITMIGSGFFFSFVVGRMASVMSKLDSVRNAQLDKLESVTTFLKDVDLPRALSKRVLEFYKKQQVKPYDRQQVLSTMPFELRSKILRHLYAEVIARVPLLQTMAHDHVFLTDVCVRLQHYTCSGETFVYQRGEVGGDVFILVRGELHVLDLDKETELFKIPDGTVFGEATVLRHMEGFTRAKRTDNVWCATPCTMLRVAQEDMSDLLERYPELLDTLKKLNRARNIRHQLLKSSSIKAIHGQEQTVMEAGGLTGGRGMLGRVSSGRQGVRQAKLGALKDLPMLLDVGEAFTPRLSDPTHTLAGQDLNPNHPFRDEQQLSAVDNEVQEEPWQERHQRASTVTVAQGLSVRPRSVPDLRVAVQALASSRDGSSSIEQVPERAGTSLLPARALAGLERGISADATDVAAGCNASLLRGAAQKSEATSNMLPSDEWAQQQKRVADQFQAVAEELSVQRALIQQVPRHIISQLVMVLSNPTPEQRHQLERAAEEFSASSDCS